MQNLLRILTITVLFTGSWNANTFGQKNEHVTVILPNATPDSVSGQIHARAPDGSLLVEEPGGRLHILSATDFTDVKQHETPFVRLSADEMATHLLSMAGSGFEVVRTDNFVICSEASPLYTAFCGRLMQKVVAEYQKLILDAGVNLKPVPDYLPVIVFRNSATFQEFAREQHPGIDFSDVPGYYSIRDNQMLIAAVSGEREFRSNGDVVRELRKNLRQVETIVHETVHQLAFNTGLQVRYGDNPLWFSEGLAVYFEAATGTGNSLWSLPGGANRIHLPGFKAATTTGSLRLPLPSLISSDASFSSKSAADAYAEGWASVHCLLRRDRDAFARYVGVLQQRVPLAPVRPEQRLDEFRMATGKTLDEFQTDLLRHMKRVRSR